MILGRHTATFGVPHTETGEQKIQVSVPPEGANLLEAICAFFTAATCIAEANGVQPRDIPQVVSPVFDAFIEDYEEGLAAEQGG